MIKTGSPQFLYMCEAEGCDKLVNTRQAKLNATVQEIKDFSEDSISKGTFLDILRAHNLLDLTQDEFEWIQQKIK